MKIEIDLNTVLLSILEFQLVEPYGFCYADL